MSVCRRGYVVKGEAFFLSNSPYSEEMHREDNLMVGSTRLSLVDDHPGA